MTELATHIASRIDGVRTCWEIDMSDMGDQHVGDGVIFIRGGVTLVMLPTVADDMLAVEVDTFRDGVRIESTIITIGATT
jgi:hypothetical protein